MENKEFRIQNKRLLLTYKTHLNKDEVKIFFEKISAITFIRSAHETGDEECPYLHTHVLVEFVKAFNSRKPNIFDINGIHPHIKPVTSAAHHRNTMTYLGKEDPANADLKCQKTLVSKIQEAKSLNQALTENCKTPSMANGIKMIYDAKVNEFVGYPISGEANAWQLELEDLLINKPDDRRICWIYDNGNTGKTWFMKYMYNKYQNKVFMCTQTGNSKDFATIISSACDAGWTGEVCLINLSRNWERCESLYSCLENIKDGIITTVKYSGKTLRPFKMTTQICVFANFEPHIKNLSIDRWWIASPEAKYVNGECVNIATMKLRRFNINAAIENTEEITNKLTNELPLIPCEMVAKEIWDKIQVRAKEELDRELAAIGGWDD